MDMDLDGPATKETKKTTKRKAGNDNERLAKKAKRADTDPWKLSSRPCKEIGQRCKLCRSRSSTFHIKSSMSIHILMGRYTGIHW